MALNALSNSVMAIPATPVTTAARKKRSRFPMNQYPRQAIQAAPIRIVSTDSGAPTRK